MYEHRTHRLLSRIQFARRAAKHVLLALLIIALALGIGVLGYHYFAQLPWLDALLNASMILSGMGPVDTLHKSSAKLFASVYALFSGLVFIGVASLLVAPFVHRLFHKLHVEEK
jgi:xanthine/uracil permease